MKILLIAVLLGSTAFAQLPKPGGSGGGGTGGTTLPCTQSGSNTNCAGNISSGGTAPGEIVLAEAAASGHGTYVSWLAPTSIPVTYRMVPPVGVPTTGQVMTCSTPVANVSTCSWTSGGGGVATSQGTYASKPATCAIGDLYFLTNSLYKQLRCSATNTWSHFYDGKLITPIPLYGSWTTDANGAAPTLTETYGYTTVSTTAAAGTISGRYIAAPAAPYKLSFSLRPELYPENYGAVYVAFRQGSGANTGRLHMIQMTYSAGTNTYSPHIRVDRYTGGTYGSTDATINPAFGIAESIQSQLYFQLEDDNTTVYFRYSSDGQTWRTLYSVARSTWVDMASTPQIELGIASSGSNYISLAHFLGIY